VEVGWVISTTADPSGHAVEGVGLRLLACWDYGFESRRGHGCLSCVSVMCFQVEVYVMGWSLVQKSPTDCGVSACDPEALLVRSLWPTRGCCAMGEFSLLTVGLTDDFCLTQQQWTFDNEVTIPVALVTHYLSILLGKCWTSFLDVLGHVYIHDHSEEE